MVSDCHIWGDQYQLTCLLRVRSARRVSPIIARAITRNLLSRNSCTESDLVKLMTVPGGETGESREICSLTCLPCGRNWKGGILHRGTSRHAPRWAPATPSKSPTSLTPSAMPGIPWNSPELPWLTLIDPGRVVWRELWGRRVVGMCLAVRVAGGSDCGATTPHNPPKLSPVVQSLPSISHEWVTHPADCVVRGTQTFPGCVRRAPVSVCVVLTDRTQT